MSTLFWPLALFDAAVVLSLYFFLRYLPPLGGRVLMVTGINLLGFVFHALLFFRGALLFLQLATIASVIGVLALRTRRFSRPAAPTPSPST